jgi:Toastrack DUF4097
MSSMPQAATQTTDYSTGPRRRGEARLPMTPGRRAALVIGIPACLALVAATGLTLVADFGVASFQLRSAFPASAPKVGLSINGGQVTLRQAQVSQATVVGTAHYSLIRPHPAIVTSGGTATLDYRCPAVVGDCELDATLVVPVGLPASVNTDGGDATVIGTSGPVDVATGGGNITAEQLAGTVTLATSGGDVNAAAITAPAFTARSGGGNITVVFASVPRHVTISTSGGDVTVIVPRGPAQYHVNSTTGGGSVNDSLSENSASPNEITATSGGGNITLREQ